MNPLTRAPRPTDPEPLVLVIDEMATLPGEAADMARRIATAGRKNGVVPNRPSRLPRFWQYPTTGELAASYEPPAAG
ncbi:hypothetical protein ACGFYY_32655 [Streptomyces sp. NPDC048331]|uniref:hypothetical protein n=1 Tax=unclassified Streptomyces TaxID=2593676 RepID=UPI00365BD855